jgi:phospholipase C
MADLSAVKNIIVVMMENRSFDHMLGHLSLPPFSRTDVEGLGTDPAWLARFTNVDQGQGIQPFLSLNPYDMPAEFDPPHERPNMALNLGALQDGKYAMNGFVSGIPSSVSTDPAVRKLVMSYFGAEQLPISQFFAQNFTICDHWFACLPAGTQPNRLMSMGGYSRIDMNHDLLPAQDLVYDWLTRQGISWCVYHQGIPFFTMMPHWIPEILDSRHFRRFEDLESDLMSTPPGALPQVIFVEPSYQDAPHLGFATDDHAPDGVSNGQEFLMQTYNAVTNSPAFWKGAVMIVDYDENGGFFDHVSPPLIPTAPQPDAGWTDTTPFASLGVRTPAYVISPFVKAGATSHALLDHTSVLKFIGEKFGTGGSYLPVVDARPVQSLSDVLDFTNPILAPPSAPALDAYLASRPAPPDKTIPPTNTQLQSGFQKALTNLKQQGADENHPKFGELIKAVEGLIP